MIAMYSQAALCWMWMLQPMVLALKVAMKSCVDLKPWDRRCLTSICSRIPCQKDALIQKQQLVTNISSYTLIAQPAFPTFLAWGYGIFDTDGYAVCMLSFETYEVPVEIVRWRGSDVDSKFLYLKMKFVCTLTSCMIQIQWLMMFQYSVLGPGQRCYRGLSIAECLIAVWPPIILCVGSNSIFCHCWWLQNSTRMYGIEVATGPQKKS